MSCLRVLIVDDNARLADTMAELLREEGFEVAVASSGTEALATSQAEPPDLAIVDVDLPDMQGLTLARRLARLAGGCSLVVISARDPERLIPACEEIGAVFLAKPFPPSHLLAAVRATLDRRRREISAASSRRLLAVRKPKGLLQHARPPLRHG